MDKKGDKKGKKSVSWSRETLADIKRRMSEERTSPRKTMAVPGRKPEATRRPAETEREGPRKKGDEELFLEAMSDVRELPEFRSMRIGRAASGYRGVSTGKRGAALDRELLQEEAGRGGINLAQTDEYMEWCGPGVRKDLCEALHGGRIPAQDRIDLHGLMLEEARVELEGFIRRSRQKGLRCVNVVHGRGLRSPNGPVIKNGVREWIETGPLRKLIMAYATAPARDGGPGATYLLIR